MVTILTMSVMGLILFPVQGPMVALLVFEFTHYIFSYCLNFNIF